MERLIVCAANRTKCGVLILGVRHWDEWMVSHAELLTEDQDPWEQGFIDNQGNFLSREEAWVVANEAGQIRRRVGGDDGRLFSENLY